LGQIIFGEEYPDRPTILVAGTQQAVADTLDRGCWWHISGCAIRTMAFRQIGDFKPDMPQTGDWEWLLRCLANGSSVLYLPRSTMRYRQYETSVSSISLRQARDIRESLRVFATYHDLGYLSSVDYRRKVRDLLWHLSRRALVRAARGDFIAMRHHGNLLAEASAKYVLGRL
jgi:hypothetical protein